MRADVGKQAAYEARQRDGVALYPVPPLGRARLTRWRVWDGSLRAPRLTAQPVKLWIPWQKKSLSPIALRSGPRATK